MARTDKIPTLDDYRRALKSKGLKATPQRLAVHTAMMEFGHASADMVHSLLKSRDGRCPSVATIYNILSQMALLGIYKHRLSVGNKMFFDVNTSRHLHLYDTVNNEYKDVSDEELMDLIDNHLKGRKFKGYKVDAVDVQILCHPSRRKKPLAF